MSKRSLEEAHSEVSRELSVRRRCYARWIQDGKLSAVEASDRMERLEAALSVIDRAISLAAPVPSPALVPVPAHTEQAPAHRIIMTLRRAPGETDDDWTARVEAAQAEYDSAAVTSSGDMHSTAPVV